MKRTVLAIDGEGFSSAVKAALEKDGISVGCSCRTGAEAVRAVKAMDGGVVICSYRLPDMTANDIAECLEGAAPILVVAKPRYLDMCQGDGIFRLAVPVRRSELTGTVRMILKLDSGRDPDRRHRRSDEENGLIDKAKAMLMEKDGLSEEEAHRYLQKRSMDFGRTMADTAGLVIGAFQQQNV